MSNASVAEGKTPVRRARRSRDVIALLRGKHRRLRALFRQFDRCEAPDQRAALAERICQMLTVQMMAEGQVFFPAFREATGDIQACSRAEVEHDAMKRLIALITSAPREGELFVARMRVLGHLHDTHVQQKEMRDGMFAEAVSAGMDLEALGARLRSRCMVVKSRLELLQGRVPDTREVANG